MKTVYLDYSATTPVDPRVVEVMLPFWNSTYGNPSSVHRFGREARFALEEARERIARAIGASPAELVFTSGGTESNNYALKGVAQQALKSGKNHIIISAIEHHSVLEPAESLREIGCDVEILPVDSDGLLDPESVRRALKPTTALVSAMHANNEIGTIQPIKEIVEIAHAKGVAVHTDAVQTLGKVPVRADELGVDLLSITAHKIYGPKGVGAIYIRKGTNIDALLQGGTQESNRRAGTENVAFAVGFAKAVELCAGFESEQSRIGELKERLRQLLLAEFDGILVNGHPTRSLNGILNISFDSKVTEIDGDALIMGMDLRGVAVTSGSACTSGSLQPSHVLLALGRDHKTARASIRFSMGRWTTDEDIAYAVEALREVVAHARKRRTSVAKTV
ncbi:MAG TPA: cysteine desulfurase family protein [Bacteroidota bacterium]|nr:cysteine desulfurase family protein [Bacteroidota bacterium]